MKRRIGVLGGTFDPPHIAHLVLAASACQDLDLDQVWFIPAGRPPHKRNHPVSPAKVRLELLRRALRGRPEFRAISLEIDRRGPSYTVDTLETLHGRFPATDWWLLVGSDMLRDLPNWRRPRRLLELVGIAAMARPGHPGRWPAQLPRRRYRKIDAPRLDLSSSELRERVARGASIRFLVPEAVESYILRHRLYLGAALRSPDRRTGRASGGRSGRSRP
jgi:nicotinate-nucleotide adenylyltransferase